MSMPASLCALFRAGTLALLLSPGVVLAAPAATLSDNGIVIETGNGGPLTLYYPILTNDAGSELHKAESKNVGANSATITYEGGAKVDVTIGDSGMYEFHFSGLPHEVTQWKMDSIMPLPLVQGGKWKVLKASGAFPASVGKDPHLFASNATSAEVMTAKGGKITWTLPQYTYLEITDNRAWQWDAFNVCAHVPLAEQTDFKFQVAVTGQ